MKKRNVVWQDRKRNFLGLPWTFTKYMLDSDKLYIDTGFFSSTEDEVRLYRITDVTLHRSLWQKIIRTGTIHCDSADRTKGNFDIVNVKNALEVKDTLSELVENCRQRNRVYTREDMVSGRYDMEDNPDAHDQDAEWTDPDAPEYADPDVPDAADDGAPGDDWN